MLSSRFCNGFYCISGLEHYFSEGERVVVCVRGEIDTSPEVDVACSVSSGKVKVEEVKDFFVRSVYVLGLPETAYGDGSYFLEISIDVGR